MHMRTLPIQYTKKSGSRLCNIALGVHVHLQSKKSMEAIGDYITFASFKGTFLSTYVVLKKMQLQLKWLHLSKHIMCLNCRT